MDNYNNATFNLNRGPTKPFKTIQEQLELLESRGLIIHDRENALDILNRTNYYRLSAYSLSLRSDDCFLPGTSFDDIYELYRFDDALRILVVKYSQYVEVSFRSYIAYEHAKRYGPLGYMDKENFSNPFYHLDFINKLKGELKKSDDLFIHHHKRDLGNVFPVWVALECCTFGNLSKMYKNMLSDDKSTISRKYIGISREYVENWLQALVFMRNIAAHGGRLYNRKLRTVPLKLPKKYHGKIDSMRAFAFLYALHRLQPTVNLARSLRLDLATLFSTYPGASLERLGFPSDWLQILEANVNTNAFDYSQPDGYSV